MIYIPLYISKEIHTRQDLICYSFLNLFWSEVSEQWDLVSKATCSNEKSGFYQKNLHVNRILHVCKANLIFIKPLVFTKDTNIIGKMHESGTSQTMNIYRLFKPCISIGYLFKTMHTCRLMKNKSYQTTLYKNMIFKLHVYLY